MPTAGSSMPATATTAAPAPTETSFLTPDRILLMNNMSAILAGISLAFCLVVLAVVAVLFSDKYARKSLDRLSFRLLVYALISNCIYSVGYIICVKVNPGFWCTAGVWLIQFWLGVTNWLILCIAVNLQIVLVHSMNTLQLEKYYVIGTICLNIAITLPPLIKGKFGWDPVIGVCWLTSENSDDRLIWQISTQLFWILLAVVITTVSALITVGYLYKHRFVSEKALKDTDEDRQLRLNAPINTLPRLNAHGKPVDQDRMHIRGSVTESASRALSGNSKFRNIIMRISLYPIMMVVLNLVITVADIRISTAKGIYSRGDYSLYIIYYALYGARGIFYAIIAIIDPSILRGIYVWRGLHSTTTSSASDEPYDFTVGGGMMSVQAEITRFVEEIGIYDVQNRSGASIPPAPLMPAVTRPGRFDVPARVTEANAGGAGGAGGGGGADDKTPQQDGPWVERGRGPSAEGGEEDRATEEARQRQQRTRNARLEAEKLVKRQI